MASPYTSTSVSGYNSSPPVDDGSQTSANRVKWSTIKTKLSDPLNTFAGAVNTALATAFGKVLGGAGVVSTAISYSVSTTNQSGLVKATASGITITTPDATDVGSPFVFQVLNLSSGDITLDGFSAQTVNSVASITLPSGEGLTIWTDGSNWLAVGRRTGSLGRGYIDGCILSNNGTDATNDIDIAAGACRDSTNAIDITCAAMTKQLDANWVAGTNQGFRNSAAGIANTTYHIYAVATAAGVQDYYAHTSATVATVLTALQAESGGSAYVYARRIGSIVRASAAILGFTQHGDKFRLKSSNRDINLSSPGTAAVTHAFTSLPLGIVIWSDASVSLLNATTSYYWLATALDETDVTPAGTAFSYRVDIATAVFGGPLVVKLNTSAQFRARQSSSGASDNASVTAHGWLDLRGRDA